MRIIIMISYYICFI